MFFIPIDRKTSRGCLCLCLLFCISMLHADPRQLKNPSAPHWLNAVGKLDVPSQSNQAGHTEHYIEHCSATLIAAMPNRSANTIITAWHCLENYLDLSRDISFTLFHGENNTTRLSARPLSSGGNLDLDWAILRLNKPIPNSLVKAMIVNRGDVIKSGQTTMTMAGYSADSGLGKGGEVLTYHAGCESGEEIGQQFSSNCLAYKGASGGPVVISRYRDNKFHYNLAGIISQGNGLGYTTFVPNKAFIAALLRLIGSTKR
jgi:V8-like Glu-specific endopeptidase